MLERWSSTTADANTAVGAAALLLNDDGSRNTAVGAAAMVNNAGDADRRRIIQRRCRRLCAQRITRPDSVTTPLAIPRSLEISLALQNTAVGDLALENNDATGNGAANYNTAVGASALLNNVTGSENTAVGAGAGPNMATGFNNTYVGNFVGDRRHSPTTKTVRSASATSRTGTGPGP